MNSPPVLFLIFNRPEKTRIVFEKIRKAKPAKLFIAADGPRTAKPDEAELCKQTQLIVIENIDWPCEVKTLFREKNMGCKLAISSAITWFFEQVEEGIILEDDCLPDLTFFQFCTELLDTYKNDRKVMMISGFNLHPEPHSKQSYYFSRYGCIWGWATWKRAWQHYDLEMKDWPEYRSSGIMSSFLSKRSLKKRTALFNACLSGNISTWDLQWTFSRWNRNGLSIIPETNLIENIGTTGVHMKPYDPCLTITSAPMSFPLNHPPNKNINLAADHRLEKEINRGPFQVLKLVFDYLNLCRKQNKNLFIEIRDVVISLVQEVISRIKNTKRII